MLLSAVGKVLLSPEGTREELVIVDSLMKNVLDIPNRPSKRAIPFEQAVQNLKPGSSYFLEGNSN